MRKQLLVIAIALLSAVSQTCTAEERNLQKEISELYKPVDGKILETLTILPPWIARQKNTGSDSLPSPGVPGRNGCPDQVNIGSVVTKNTPFMKAETNVKIDGSIVIRCK